MSRGCGRKGSCRFSRNAAFCAFLPAQFSERREDSHPETDDGRLVVGRARRLLRVHPREPPGQAPGGVRPRGHVAGRGVLRQLRDPGAGSGPPAGRGLGLRLWRQVLTFELGLWASARRVEQGLAGHTLTCGPTALPSGGIHCRAQKQHSLFGKRRLCCRDLRSV